MAKGSGGTRGAAGGGRQKQQNGALWTADFEGMHEILKQHYANMTEQEKYKATQNLANELQSWANQDATFIQEESGRLHIHDSPDRSLGYYLDEVQKHGGFAANVAASVAKTHRYGRHYGTVAKMSNKQAWILAKAGVEHAIPTFGNMHTQKVTKIKTAPKFGKAKTKTLIDFVPINPGGWI